MSVNTFSGKRWREQVKPSDGDENLGRSGSVPQAVGNAAASFIPPDLPEASSENASFPRKDMSTVSQADPTSTESPALLHDIHRGPWLDIHQNFVSYVLHALELYDDSSNEIVELSKQWAQWDSLTSLANYSSVVQILFQYLTNSSNLNHDSAINISNRLSADVSSVLLQMNSILSDRATYRHFLNSRGAVAQQLLDLLQDLLDSSHELTSRALFSKALLRLSGECGLHPTCFTLIGVEKMGQQVAGGGFGDIWKGSIGGQTVAVKSMRQFKDDEVNVSIKTLGREALIWRQLSHPNLLPFFGMYVLEHRLCLISPWMDNGNLKEFLKNDPSGVNRVSLMVDVARGLEYLHSQDVVHGDLKPVNILVTPSGGACISDFGLSTIVDELSLKMSFSSRSGRAGTVRYQAPELLKNECPTHFGSDIYAFGCVGYEILTGKVPFYEVANEAAVICKVVIDEARPLGLEMIFPDDLRLLLEDCWNQKAETRPISTAILRRLLKQPTGDEIKGSHPPDWDSTYSARFRRSIQEWPLLPSIAEVEVFCSLRPTTMASVSAHFAKSNDAQYILDDIHRQFQFSPEAMVDITRQFLHEFKVGLGNYNHPMAMIPTFVTGVPKGTETGTFLALDLDGTDMRVCEVVLHGDTTFTLRQQKYKVSDALKTGEATVLFDYLADAVDAFPTSHAPPSSHGKGDPFSQPSADVVHLGLSFSFPVEQTALDSGKILTWTKGFSAKHAIGNDVVKLLQDAFDRKHMHVKCVALVNDTVGALLSRAYTGGGCMLGAIFGTGTNGAYVEDLSNIRKLANHPAGNRGGIMVVNTEWGAFNNTRSHLPSTPFDNALDQLSINPRFQAFEKMISGMYLGEITRNILLSLVNAAPKALLFGGKTTPTLNAQWGFDTSFMSGVEEEWEGKESAKGTGANPVPQLSAFDDPEKKLDPTVKTRLERVRAVLVKDLGFKEADVSLRDAAIVRWAGSLVSRRAALLSGLAVATVLIQTGRAVLSGQGGKPTKNEPRINVGVDGSLIEFYPHFEDTLRKSLRILVGEEVEKRVDIGMAKDGSGVGAALCALQAIKQL